MTIEAEIIPPEKAKRPSEFTDDIFERICDRMAEGEGLREICSDPEMPSKTTFLRWVDKDTGRQRRYQGAREALMDHYAEEIRSIAWDDSKDTIKREGKPDLCNHEWINRSRLKVDTLKFLMAKLHPKRYGDKTELMVPPDDAMVVRWEKIQRVIVRPGEAIHDDDGRIITDETGLRDRIVELERRLGMRDDPQPPKLITWDPGPLPSRMDGEIVERLVGVIKRRVPNADQRPPETVLDEIMSQFDEFLASKVSEDAA